MRSIQQIILFSFLSFTIAIAIDNNNNNNSSNNIDGNSANDQSFQDNISLKKKEKSNLRSSDGNYYETTVSPLPSPAPSVSPQPSPSNVTTISPSPSVAPTITPMPSNNQTVTPTTPPPTTAAPTTPPPTTPPPTTAPPTTAAPTAPPTQHKHHEWWQNFWKFLLKTMCWSFLAGLFFFAFGAVMSNRYRIYYYLRGSWYTLLRKIRLRRSDASAPSSTLNEIIFSDNTEGLLMRETS